MSTEKKKEGLFQRENDGKLDDRFLEAWINRSHTVCGVRLRPYCLNHALLLAVLESPLGMDNVPAGFGLRWDHLWLAVTICALDYEEEFTAPSPFWCEFKRRLHRYDLRVELEKFRAYQNDYLSSPNIFCSDGDGKPLTAPAILARAVALQRGIGLTEYRVWTMPIGKALWMHATYAEQINENISLVDEEVGETLHFLRQIQDGQVDLEELFASQAAPKESKLDVFGSPPEEGVAP
jgi:hypothetical protein